MTENTAPKGFRRDIMVLHALSDLMEKHPDLPRPMVEFGPRYMVEETASIRWFVHADWGIRRKYSWEDDRTEEEREQDYRDKRRIDIEERIAAIVSALEEQAGGTLEWEKNDPSKEEYYYQLSLSWHGARLVISTNRDDVCEKVVVLETEREEEVPDPAVIEAVTKAAPLVKVKVKDTITEWQCNSRLAEATAPKHIRTVTKVEVS